MLSSSASEHGIQSPKACKARPPDLESTIATLQARVLAIVVRPQFEEIKGLLLSIVRTLRPGRNQRTAMVLSFGDRIVDLSIDVLIFLEETEDMQNETARDLLCILQEVKRFILSINRLQSSPCSGSAFSKVLSTKCHAYEQRISSLFETLMSSLSNVPEPGMPTTGEFSHQEPSHRSSSTLFSHARDFTIHGSDFYSAPGSTFHFVTNVVEGSSQSVEKSNIPSLPHDEDIELEREICKGREYRVHTGRLHGKAVVVKVFQGPRAKQLLLKNAELNREIMHPNVLRLIGGPAPDSRSSFLVFDGEYHETVESQLAMSLTKGIKESYVIGANTVITCSLGLDYLQELGLPFSLMSSDHFCLMVSKQGRVVLTFDADATWELASNNSDRSVTAQSDTVKKICNEVIQKTFYSSCKKYYRDQRVYDNDADEVHLDNDDGFDQDDDLEKPLSGHDQDAPDRSSASRKSPQKAKGHRRELVWKPASTGSDSLEEIGQHYQASLAQLQFENILIHRRSQSATRIAHRCLGYKRTEIVLTPDIKRSGIVSHISPVPNEICSVCGQNVGTETILRLLRALAGTGVGGNGGNSMVGVESSGHSGLLAPDHHGHTQSMGGGLSGGLGSMGESIIFDANYSQIQVQQQQQQQNNPSQFLHPNSGGGGGAGKIRLPSAGHFRRASSGSRSDRGAGVGRASPYPSPNSTPQVIYEELQKQENGVGGVAVAGLGLGYIHLQQGQQQFNDLIGGGGGGGLSINPAIDVQGDLNARQNMIPTGQTANPWARRREQDAKFVCTVPGCNSTFTRAFNLKGHLRSHNEEKPFKCQLPGCEKGFARQHDCKRHEQLHNNFRPFECVGCRKLFARIDALDRHLRSEAGAECARFVARAGGAGGAGSVNVDVDVAKQGLGSMMGGGMMYDGNGGMGMGISMDVDIQASA